MKRKPEHQGFGFNEFKALEKMFPDGFLILHARPDGLVRYAKFNPRRIELLEDWEKQLVNSAEQAGPNFWKGFISKDEIPDYFPKDWEKGGDKDD